MPTPPFPDTPSGQPPLKFRVKQFGGFNNNGPRASIGDNDGFWMENLFPVADGNLRAMYAEAAPLFTSAKTIINAYFAVLFKVPYAIMFFSDGAATQVDLTASTTTSLAGAGTFFAAGAFAPVAVQWNAGGIVILGSNTANAFWAWDSSTLTAPGGAAPNWLTNTTPTTMPNGINGNALEVYQNRLWLTSPFSNSAPPPTLNQSTITTSAPGNGADFTIASGGVVTPQQDSGLRTFFNALKQANGFLYALGDSNVAQISNVQTAGSPAITTYSNQNLDPQTGCTWQNTAQLLGQALIFANRQGVYVLAGGLPQKISYELDRMFAGANFTIAPSAAVAVIFGVKCYLILINAPDQNNSPRTFLCVWNTQKWWIASTINLALNQVWTLENNGVMTAWGSDGPSLFQLFQAPSTQLQKILVSKLWAGGQADDEFMIYKKVYRFYESAFDYSGQGIMVSATVDTENGSVTPFQITVQATNIMFVNGMGQLIIFRNSTPAAIVFTVTRPSIYGTDVSAYGRMIGVTQSFIGSDFALVDYALEYAADATFLG